ncbi:MAG TPA: VanZ family protein [Rhizomicrobium sp.]|nr:VanZ family protein [Rhizomicrobium sp.]
MTARPPVKLGPRLALVAAVALVILYGSLYPFAFQDTGTFAADLAHLLGTWRQGPQGRGDFLANLVLYAPLGLTMMLTLERLRPKGLAVILAVLAGAILSLTVELAQFYDTSRVSALSDVYLNVAGTLGGAALAWVGGWGLEKASWPHGSAPSFARLLLLAWVGWRLYPYVPVIDLHKYWHALRPLLSAVPLAPENIFRYGTLWLSVAFLLRTGFRPARPGWWLFWTIAAFFVAKILIVGQSMSREEILGAPAAMILDALFFRRSKSAGPAVLAALLLAVVLWARLSPWHFTASLKHFQWVPFFGFLHGSLQVNLISFCEKFYSYGVVILLLTAAGMRLPAATALECTLLLVTSVLQTFMVARSAEVTDAVLALACGVVYALLRRQDQAAGRSG